MKRLSERELRECCRGSLGHPLAGYAARDALAYRRALKRARSHLLDDLQAGIKTGDVEAAFKIITRALGAKP